MRRWLLLGVVIVSLGLGGQEASQEEYPDGSHCTNTQSGEGRCPCDGACRPDGASEPTTCLRYCRKDLCACKCMT